MLPDQFTAVESRPQTPFDLRPALLHCAVQAAETMAFVLLISGAFGVLMATGTL